MASIWRQPPLCAPIIYVLPAAAVGAVAGVATQRLARSFAARQVGHQASCGFKILILQLSLFDRLKRICSHDEARRGMRRRQQVISSGANGNNAIVACVSTMRICKWRR